MHNVDIRNVSLGQIQYLVKVAEYGNITKAAEYFNLSQPTLSKKLKSLEAQLDLQIFLRTNNTISLTPAGKYLYGAWKHMVGMLEEDIQYAHVLQTGNTKNIVVACLDSFRPESFLLPVVESFTDNYPDTHIRIESDSAQDIRRMLISNEVDVIFSIHYDFENKGMDQIDWKLLGKTSHCACMKKDNPLAQKESLSMEDLKLSDFICISPQFLPEYGEMIHKLCKPFGFSPNIVNYVTSANSLTLNIQTDRDVFICDKYYSDLNSGEHCLIPIRDTESGFVMAWRKDNKKPYLSDFVQEALLLFDN
jgi:DNA-binding transcriptional LysR family regulator